MLSLKYSILKPYLVDKTRLAALNSGVSYGSPLHSEHIMERMNGIIGVLSDDKVYDQLAYLKAREMPDLTRGRVYGGQVSSDILLGETHRQARGISERYRKGLVSLEDFRNISEPSTRYHRAISRGYERHLVDHINRLDSEYIDRTTFVPIIVYG